MLKYKFEENQKLLMMNSLKPEIQDNSNLSYLIIDDEIAVNPGFQEDFIDDLGFTNTNPQFVASCEEAIELLKRNLEIRFCFLDCKLPRTKKETYNYNPNCSSDSGIELIEEIAAIKREIPIIIFSAYVDKTVLKKQTAQKSNIVGYLKKDEPPESYREAFKLALNFCNIPVEQYQESSERIISIGHSKFNYDELPTETSIIIRQKTQEISNLLRITAQSVIQIGKNLTFVKKTLPHGQFYSWFESEFPWHIRHANRFMRVYDKFKNTPDTDLNLLPITVLYELAPKSVSDEVVTETIEMAKAGESITVAKVKDIKSKYSNRNRRSPKNLEDHPQKAADSKSEVIHSSPANSSPSTINREDRLSSSNYSTPSSDSQRLDSNFSIAAPPKFQTEKQQILQVIPKQRLWQLEKHIIYHGEPNSGDFLKLLPERAALCLNFSRKPNFQFQFESYDSWMSFHSQHPHLKTRDLLDLIDKTIENTTNESDDAIVLYIPHSNILNIVNNLFCRAFIVDPNYEKCLSVVNRGLDQ